MSDIVVKRCVKQIIFRKINEDVGMATVPKTCGGMYADNAGMMARKKGLTIATLISTFFRHGAMMVNILFLAIIPVLSAYISPPSFKGC